MRKDAKDISISEPKDRAADQIKFIGIGGGNGKTTMAKMIQALFIKSGLNVGLISHYEITAGYERMEEGSSFMDCEKFWLCVNRMAAKGIDVILIEFNFLYIDLKILDQIELDAVLYASIDLKYEKMLANFSKYIALQKKILDRLRQNGTMIIGSDDENNVCLLKGNGNHFIITYGFSPRATVTASSMNVSPMLEFYCCIQRGLTTRKQTDVEPMEFPIRMNLLGKHNVYNALGAVAVCLLYGISIDKIMAGFKAFKGPRRRLEQIYDQEYQIIDDIAQNASGLDCVFETIQSIDYKDLHILIGIGKEKSGQNHLFYVDSFCNGLRMLHCTHLITTCHVDFTNREEKIVKEQINIFHRNLEKNNIRFIYKESLQEAIQTLLAFARQGDLLLILGEEINDARRLVKEVLMERR